MAWTVRSLADLGADLRGKFRQYLPGTDASLKQNVLSVFAKTIALLSHEYELRLAWLYRQLFMSTADAAHLEMHCADYRIYRKASAVSAGTLLTSGLPNVAYPAGLRYLSGGQSFLTVAGGTTDANGDVSFHAVSEQTGQSTRREGGAVLELADPALAPTLSREAEVSAAGLGGGADRESDDSLRARGLDRKARPPQGGALSDYEQFALAVPGVVAAWAVRFLNGAGTIGVYFLFEGRENLIPTEGDVAVVEAAIRARRLIRSDPVAIAPLPQAVDMTIAGLDTDTPETRANIYAAFSGVLIARGRPGTTAEPFMLSRSWIAEAVSAAVGENRHVLVQPSADITFTGGHYPVPGVVTYG